MLTASPATSLLLLVLDWTGQPPGQRGLLLLQEQQQENKQAGSCCDFKLTPEQRQKDSTGFTDFAFSSLYKTDRNREHALGIICVWYKPKGQIQ